MIVNLRPTLTVAASSAVALGIAPLGAVWVVSDSRADARAHDDAWSLWESKELSHSFDFSAYDVTNFRVGSPG